MQVGAVNPLIPDVYVNVVTPRGALPRGVSTDKIAFVGTAPWGPVNAPVPFGSLQDYVSKFGNPQNRKYDMGTAAMAAALQGAQNNVGVRVTDGTDVAATIIVQSTCITFTSKYSGSGANADTVTIANGSAANTFKATVLRPGRPPEVFDNITGAANALWVNMAAAINGGQSGQRGPSDLIVATAGVGTTAPTLATYTLTGGTDGTTTITGPVLVGADTGTRTGMYALRGIGPAMLVLADNDTSTTWATQIALALQEGFYAIATGPAGEHTNIATVAANKVTAAVDSFAMKLLVGDWCYLLDNINGGVVRMVSPQGFMAGRLAALGPHESSLNKPIAGIVATQKSLAQQNYSSADLAAMGAAGLDVIATPAPGGNFFAARQGLNSSSNAAIHDDNYSRMVPYLSANLGQIGGQFVGLLQTVDERRAAKGSFDAFLTTEWLGGRINNPQGSQPFLVVLDDTNNSTQGVAQGRQICDIKIQLGAIIRTFLVNMEAGQTVQLS